MFSGYLRSEISTTPFSETPLCPESVTILPHLEKLTKRGWWTVGSQPAVDGLPSADEIFGWGPKSGWVFQKAFVEFFCDGTDAEAIEKLIDAEGKGWVHYFMANNKVTSRLSLSLWFIECSAIREKFEAMYQRMVETL